MFLCCDLPSRVLPIFCNNNFINYVGPICAKTERVDASGNNGDDEYDGGNHNDDADDGVLLYNISLCSGSVSAKETVRDTESYCFSCGRQFKNISGLQIHNRRTHGSAVDTSEREQETGKPGEDYVNVICSVM